MEFAGAPPVDDEADPTNCLPAEETVERGDAAALQDDLPLEADEASRVEEASNAGREEERQEGEILAESQGEERGPWAHMFRQGGTDRRRGFRNSGPYGRPRGDSGFHRRRQDARDLPPWSQVRRSRGRGFRGDRDREEASLSVKEKRWMCLRTLFVTVGDEMALIPQQIQKLAREAETAIVQDREEEREKAEKKLRDRTRRGDDELESRAAEENEETDATDTAEKKAETAGEETPEKSEGQKEKNLEDRLVELLVDCASQLPLKVGIYSCVVGLWFKKSRLRSVCTRIVERSFQRFEAAIKEGKFFDAKLLLRFFVALAGSFVVSTESVFETMMALLSLCAELPPSSTTEQLLLLTLAALPWLSSRLWETHRGAVEEVLALSQQISSPASAEALLLRQACLPVRDAPFGTDGEENSIVASLGLHKSRVETLVEALGFMEQVQWKSKATFRFFQSADLFPLLKPSEAAAARFPVCSLPALTLTVEDLRQIRALPISSGLRLPVSIEKVDVPLSPHDRWILEDHFLTLLYSFRDNVTLCAEALLRVPVDHDQFDYVLVECLFSAMLRLPHAPLAADAADASFFVTRVIQRACQMQNSLVGVVEASLTSLLKHAAQFDFQSMRVLADFFAYWLNLWEGRMSLLEEWLSLSIPPACVKVFVRHAFEKAFRFRYRPNLLELLPDCVIPYIPPEPIPACPYTAEPPHESLPLPGAPPPPPAAELPLTITSYPGHLEFLEVQKLLFFSFRQPGDAGRQAQKAGAHSRGASNVAGDREAALDEHEAEREECEERGEDGEKEEREEEREEREEEREERADREDDKRAWMQYKLAKLLRGRLHRKTWKKRERRSFSESAEDAVDASSKRGLNDESREEETKDSRDAFEADSGPYEDDEEGHLWTLTDLSQVLVFALLARGLKTLTHSERLVENYFPVFQFLKKGASHKAFLEMRPATLEAAGDDEDARDGDDSDTEMEEEADEEGLTKAERRSQEVEEAFLKAIFDFWKHSRQKTVLTVRHFQRFDVVSKEGVVRFVFDSLTPTDRDDSRVMELFDLLLQLSIQEFESKKETALQLSQDCSDDAERNARGKAVSAAVEALEAVQTLLHFIVVGFMRELLREDQAARRVSLHARLLYLARDYGRYIDVSRLHVHIGDAMTDELNQLLTVSSQVQTQYFFLDREPGGLLGSLAGELDEQREGFHAEACENGGL
ncbi:putative nuclear cap-binding protein [Toxoplasma gondii VEG]|uniref:Nuclear cap binding protein, putative n=4 Tax=Toxoplasma gondii TaxID=5811 RepID=B9QCY2_TOXGV|nr:putative nuclear cap-binding protein [Toxoplasma gondii VEG]CEL78571.1 TPA: nuclear cap binding protein, putative [Toxoplasma gondii VEG]